ncbi:MAG: ribonuclease HII [Alphaproteobacteria bacterium]|nr:ribonuclease HII [Rickettsiales bacterium]
MLLQKNLTIGVDEVGRGSLIGGVFTCAAVMLPFNDSNNYIKGITDSKKINAAKRESLFLTMLQSENHIFALSVGNQIEIARQNILGATLSSMSSSIKELLLFIANPQIFQKITQCEFSPHLLEERFKLLSNENLESGNIMYLDSDLNANQVYKNIPQTISQKPTSSPILFCSKNAYNLAVRNCHILNSVTKNILVDGNKTPKISNEGKKNNVNISSIIRGDRKVYEISAASIFAKLCRDIFIKKIMHPLHPEYQWDTNYGYGTYKHIEAIKKSGITKFHRAKFLRSITAKMTSK